MESFFRRACFITVAGMAGLFTTCKKEVKIKEVIAISATNYKAIADGIMPDTIYADLPINSVASNRAVIFQSTSGYFSNNTGTITINANRTDVHSGKITAVAIWHAGLRSGLDTVFATTSTVPEFTDFLTLSLSPSLSDSIYVAPSSFTLKDTFGMHITVTAKVYNKSNGMVSQNTRIQFADMLGTTPAGGVFQPTIDTTGADSQASTVYFPPLLPAGNTTGNYITITARVIDANNTPLGKSYPTTIYITH